MAFRGGQVAARRRRKRGRHLARPGTAGALTYEGISGVTKGTSSWKPVKTFTGLGTSAFTLDGFLARGRYWKIQALTNNGATGGGVGLKDVKFVVSGTGNVTWTSGSSWGDFNNDGLVDLFVSNVGSRDELYHNTGNGSFLPVSSVVLGGLEDESFGAVWGDVDNDGNLDLFVAGGASAGGDRLFSGLEEVVMSENGGTVNGLIMPVTNQVNLHNCRVKAQLVQRLASKQNLSFAINV